MPPLFVVRAAALAAAAILTTGCGGGSSSEEDVREAVTAYFTALSDRDFTGACDRVSPGFEAMIAQFAKRAYPDLDSSECAAIARRIAAAGGDRLVGLQRRVQVQSVEVDGNRATAQLGPGQVATLSRIDGDWLIDKLDFSGATGSPP